MSYKLQFPNKLLDHFYYSPNFVLWFFIMDLLSNQPTEFFDAQKRLSDAKMPHPNNEYQVHLSFPLSPIIIDDGSKHSFESPELPERLLYMWLLPPPIDKLYPTFNALIEDVNKTTSRQGYNIVKSERTKKDKNGDFWRVRLGCRKRKAYKDKEEAPRQSV